MNEPEVRLECIRFATLTSVPANKVVELAEEMLEFVMSRASKPKPDKEAAIRAVHGVV